MIRESRATDQRPHVHVEGLRKRFGRVQALDGLDLEVDGASVVGLVGPNGSGKTTLIRVMLGLERADEGFVSVFDHPPRRLFGPDGPGIGYMPQTLAVYPDLTIAQNVDFFAKVHGVARNERAQRVEESVGLVGLLDRIDDRVATLSGGMQRRVSLACALVHRPRLLVLDEPTVGVDPDLRATMWRRFRELRDEGALILLSTHYLGEADRCDFVAFLRQGRTLAVDTPKALKRSTGTEDLEDAFLALVDREEDE